HSRGGQKTKGTDVKTIIANNDRDMVLALLKDMNRTDEREPDEIDVSELDGPGKLFMLITCCIEMTAAAIQAVSKDRDDARHGLNVAIEGSATKNRGRQQSSQTIALVPRYNPSTCCAIRTSSHSTRSRARWRALSVSFIDQPRHDIGGTAPSVPTPAPPCRRTSAG